MQSVGKWYRLGELGGAPDLLAERLSGWLRSPLAIARRRSETAPTAGAEPRRGFWALREISFELPEGQALGLVGRNGAGKSTLLKILSRITPPTEGRALRRGRIGTLLEVGTGFHPELTGRQNIYLSGAVLGMRKHEIHRRFEEIVEFSGIQRFLDTPVKRYSSGMYVRLGFSVAAHLDPDILLVDEVLAVGDAEFQRRCLNKLSGRAAAGRTVIFVSHNLGAIQRLCHRAILIEEGRVRLDGSPTEVVATYLRREDADVAKGQTVVPSDVPRRGNGHARLQRVALTDDSDRPLSSVMLGQRFRVRLGFRVDRRIPGAIPYVGVATPEGERFALSMCIDGGKPPLDLEPGEVEITVDLDIVLLPQEFTLDAGMLEVGGGPIDMVDRILSFTAANASEAGDDSYPWRTPLGQMRPRALWHEPSRIENLVVSSE